MKHCIPTHHIGNITITLKNYSKQTGWSQFELEFDAFSKTTIVLSGDTVKQIGDTVKKILKERME